MDTNTSDLATVLIFAAAGYFAGSYAFGKSPSKPSVPGGVGLFVGAVIGAGAAYRASESIKSQAITNPQGSRPNG